MLHLRDVTKTYRRARRTVHALDAVSLRIESGESIVVRGPSGSGKTTLLLTIGAMLRPTSGAVTLDDTDLYATTPARRAALRAQRIGYVFQLFNLLPYLSAADNVLLAGHARRRNALDLLDRLGIADRAAHRPRELSVGERQRVAVARALVREPSLILADEPVAGLDPESAEAVMRCLAQRAASGATLIIATHGDLPACTPTRELRLTRGKLDRPASPAPAQPTVGADA